MAYNLEILFLVKKVKDFQKLLIYLDISAHTDIVEGQLRMSHSIFRNNQKLHIFQSTEEAKFFVPRNKIGSSCLK